VIEVNKKGLFSGKLVGLIALAVVIIFSLFTYMFFTYSVTVTPGNEVVLIDQPYFFGHQGVRPDTLKDGRELLWNTTKSQEVAVVPQSIEVTFDDISSKDNILLDFSTTIQYRITNPAVLLDKYGADWFKNNVLNQYSTIVRQAVKSQEMGKIMSDPVTSTAVDQDVTEKFRQLVTDTKLPIEVLNITLGRAKPNDNVLQQMNQTAAEQQRFKTLVAATAAEGQRQKSEEARAIADNAYRNAMQMNPEQFVQLQVAKLYSEACHGSEHCIITSGQGPVVFTK
jgi:regulator of protease activity HflC (stomatin/prohibitin superfamily)